MMWGSRNSAVSTWSLTTPQHASKMVRGRLQSGDERERDALVVNTSWEIISVNFEDRLRRHERERLLVLGR